MRVNISEMICKSDFLMGKWVFVTIPEVFGLPPGLSRVQIFGLGRHLVLLEEIPEGRAGCF